MGTATLTVTVQRGPGGVLVSLTGEVTLGTIARLRDALRVVYERPRADVVVDVDGVAFFDSAGLATLVAARRRCAAAGGSLRLRGVSPALARLLAASGLHRVFAAEPAAGRPTRVRTHAAPALPRRSAALLAAG